MQRKGRTRRRRRRSNREGRTMLRHRCNTKEHAGERTLHFLLLLLLDFFFSFPLSSLSPPPLKNFTVGATDAPRMDPFRSFLVEEGGGSNESVPAAPFSSLPKSVLYTALQHTVIHLMLTNETYPLSMRFFCFVFDFDRQVN